MKTMKKIVALAVALVMVLAMGVTAFAAEGSHTITINGIKNSNDTFKAYQIFSGSEADGTLGDVKWGDGVDGDALIATLQNVEGFAGVATAADVSVKLGSGHDTEIAKAFATAASKHLVKTSGTYNNGVISGLADGYYLVQNDKTDEKSAQTRFILTVVNDANVDVKTDVPKMEKKVKEKNDTTGTETEWQDASDYDIGDKVPYQISTKVVSNYAEYKTYYLKFNDTMADGLTFNNDIVVKINDEAIDSTLYSVKSSEHGFELEISNLKNTTAKAGDIITVEYSATLNENAKIGSEGNKNTANMEFSNNPNSEGDGDKGKTPDDTVITFTYKTVVNKVDKEGNALEKAGFSLFKVTPAGEVQIGTELKGDAMTTFEFKGLDAGKYILRETTTPPGYNTAADIEFEIVTAFGEEDGEENLVLKTFTATPSDKFKVDMTAGSATTDVVNNKGNELPSTGGMGTTIFYIVGAVLVLGAGVLLVTRRRVSK